MSEGATAVGWYVSTAHNGEEVTVDGDVDWHLPETDQPGAPVHGARLILRRVDALLDVLDDEVFVAEPLAEGGEETPGQLVVRSARLVSRTGWDSAAAALFALDCAAHAIGDAGTVELPTGFTLAGAIDDARHYVERANDELGARLGRLARYSAARRLRRTGETIGDIALAMLEDDLEHELDATEDPAWASTAAAGDAVLAAVEAVRHLAAPRYVSAREETAEPEEFETDAPPPRLYETPWGPIMPAAEHRSPYLGAGVLAREAALRAREAVGEDGALAERAFQRARLAEALG